MAIANGTCVSFCNRPKAHFGLPWVRPWDNRGKCYTDRKRIQCWSNAWQHILIYIQPFTSYSEILVGNCNFFLPLAFNAPAGVFLNAAARVITGTHKFDRGLSRILHTELHWLSESCTSSASWCTVAYTVRRRSTWPTSAYQSPTSLSAASQVRQSTTPGPSATPAANVRPTGFLCCWPVGLELIA